MARFFADIQGQRGEATRLGNEKSGMRGHIRGWNIGASVSMSVNDKGEDVCSVYLTNGSSSSQRNKLLGRFTEKDMEGVK